MAYFQHRALSVPLSSLRGGANPARRAPHDADTVAEMAEAIAESRVVEALDVVELPGNLYEVESGNKRFAALQLLAERKVISPDELIPVVILPRGNLSNIVENEGRTETDALSLISKILRLQAQGKTQAQIAKLLLRSRSQISRYAGVPTRLTPDVWLAIQGRRYTLTELTDLSMLPARKQRLRVGLEPMTGPPKPPKPKGERQRVRRVQTVRTELRRIQRAPRTRDTRIAAEILRWVLNQRSTLPV